jgi:predicted MFS family arabinose efflux permease
MMGVFNISLYGGLSLGPMLGGFVKDWFSIQVSFLSMGALTLCGFVLCLLLLPPEGGRNRVEARSSKHAIPYFQLIKEPCITALFSFRVSFTTGIGVIWAFLPLLADTRIHLTSSAIGVVVMINVLISGLFHAPMGYLADRIDKRWLIVSGGILGALSIYLLMQGRTFTQLFLGSGLFGLAGGIAFPAVMALGVIEGRRLDAMGSVMGLLAQAHSIGMLAGPVLGGILLDLSSFNTVFIFAILTVLGGTSLLAILYRPVRGPEGSEP